MRYIKTITISERCRIIYSTDKEAKKVVYWVEVLNKYNFWEKCPDNTIDKFNIYEELLSFIVFSDIEQYILKKRGL